MFATTPHQLWHRCSEGIACLVLGSMPPGRRLTTFHKIFFSCRSLPNPYATENGGRVYRPVFLQPRCPFKACQTQTLPLQGQASKERTRPRISVPPDTACVNPSIPSRSDVGEACRLCPFLL